jgi:hypothetical protein
MAKGDHTRAERAITSYAEPARANTNNINTNLGQTRADMYNSAVTGRERSETSYDDIMGRYREMYNSGPSAGNQAAMAGYSNLAANGAGAGWDPQFRGAISSALGGYQNFADTGGFSEQNIQDMRARGIAPTRAVYENAQSNIDRQRALQGGYSPNYTAATAKLTRDLANSIGDQNTNVNAQLAQMIQQGKLAGLGGLSQTGIGAQGMDNSISGLNLQGRLAGLGGMLDTGQLNNAQQLQALSGATNLFGTTPAYQALTGNQLLQADQNQISGQGMANDLDMGLIGATQNLSQIPGDWQQGLNTAGGLINMIGGGAGAFMGGFGGLGGNAGVMGSPGALTGNPLYDYGGAGGAGASRRS